MIEGFGGDDRLLGWARADRLTGGAGIDALQGEGGDDWLNSRDGRADSVDGGPGRDRGLVDAGVDRVASVERRNR